MAFSNFSTRSSIMKAMSRICYPQWWIAEDSYDRFVTIMRRINHHLYPAFLPEGLIPLHALIVVQWLRGFSLAAMIRRNIDYHRQRKRPFRLSVLIRNTMELVEQTARFRAPKYLSAYVDVLDLHLRNIGREDLIDQNIDIGVQLEFESPRDSSLANGTRAVTNECC